MELRLRELPRSPAGQETGWKPDPKQCGLTASHFGRCYRISQMSDHIWGNSRIYLQASFRFLCAQGPCEHHRSSLCGRLRRAPHICLTKMEKPEDLRRLLPNTGGLSIPGLFPLDSGKQRVIFLLSALSLIRMNMGWGWPTSFCRNSPNPLICLVKFQPTPAPASWTMFGVVEGWVVQDKWPLPWPAPGLAEL